MKFDLNSDCVLNNDVVDVDATCTKFRSLLMQWKDTRDTEDSKIMDAVNSVFEDNSNKRMTTDCLVALVCNKLHIQPENWTTASKRVKTFVQSDHSLSRKKGVGLCKEVSVTDSSI